MSAAGYLELNSFCLLSSGCANINAAIGWLAWHAPVSFSCCVVLRIRSAIGCLVGGGILIAALTFGWLIDRGSEAALKRALGQILDQEQADVIRRTSDFFVEPLRFLQWATTGLAGDGKGRPPVESFRGLLQMRQVDAAGWFDAGTGEVASFTPNAAAAVTNGDPLDVTNLRDLTLGNPAGVTVRWSLPYVRDRERAAVAMGTVRVGQSSLWLWCTLHLEELSSHLDSSQEQSTLVYVVDERDRLMAFPPTISRSRFGWQLSTAAPEKWLLRPTAELEDPAARMFLSGLRRAEVAKQQTDSLSPTRFLWESPQGKYFVSAFEIAQPNGARLRVYVCADYEPLIGPIVTTLKRAFVSGVAILILFTGLAVWLGRRIDNEMLQLNAEMERITQFRLESRRLNRPSRLKEIAELRDGFEAMKTGLRSFQRYVPIDLVRDLLSLGEEARIGGEIRPITVMFCDLAGFTRMAESMGPVESTALLADYFNLTERQITAQQGTVDKYLGDGVMAFWGAPRAHAESSRAACTAALGILREAARAGGTLKIRSGIAEGLALVGNVGTAVRLNYTAIGDPVNLASRLEGLAKYYGADILLSDAAAQSVRDHFTLRELDRVVVQGREKSESVWELLSTKDDRGYDEMIASYGAVLRTYREANFSRAHALIAQHRVAFPLDRAAATLQQIIAAAAKQPRPDVWDPVTRMEQK